MPALNAASALTNNGASTATSTRRSAPPNPTTNRVRWGTAMDVPERAEAIPEPISIARCRELLGDEADALTDDEVLRRSRATRKRWRTS